MRQPKIADPCFSLYRPRGLARVYFHDQVNILELSIIFVSGSPSHCGLRSHSFMHVKGYSHYMAGVFQSRQEGKMSLIP